MNKLLYIFLFSTFLISDEILTGNNVYYFTPGPNLVSFNILPDETNIQSVFSNIEGELISIISEGQISHHIEDSWVGTLTNVNHINGYWVIVSEITLLDIQGNINNPETYFLNTGANLISYPYSESQTLENALPFYMDTSLNAIIGENSAALVEDGQIFGSLTHFEPNKGYWFFLNNPIPFEYNEPIEGFSSINYATTNDIDFINPYNQSTLQSIFFINEAFYNGNNLDSNFNISILCNENYVGGKTWNGSMTDVIAMGNDGYEFTIDYCEPGQNINIKISNEDLISDMFITGNTQWENNNINIISISNIETGDINFDQTINITDIIIIIEHIIDNNSIQNSHQLFLSDVNNDNLINVSDVISLITLIIE